MKIDLAWFAMLLASAAFYYYGEETVAIFLSGAAIGWMVREDLQKWTER